ncbi:MAG TPA: heat-inducible transcriptional repressor HrcA [Nitrosomonas sp.]|nr:heat-inducible transcriptional repressor HrcA [Nitrosomonas sp.]HQX14590.1 heat-inducible transcriptional repressor HrcA [Nitrosomonas sp.]HRB21489.1 heat-inducible transcriptional repressor HrcA [Nitrosomonas sp.]HRB33825.1 heat-inducible transcriptional repressor HrcA [Nitrosomonas sp.]HRB45014.1 heat-inducible transcriptional repressor HrcA [Nitrosomonas sp.]
MLNERAQILLKTLIERYIHEGQPVGSRVLSKFSGLDLSPATIRNVMSDLEEMGLVTSPHTSAGRVPTAQGYRFFIDTLLVVQTLNKTELNHMESHLHPDNPSRLINVASHLLSELTRFAGLVITPKHKGAVFRYIEFMALSEKRILLIIVTPEGDVQNKIIFTQTPYTQADLIEAGNFINQHYAGCALDEIHRRLNVELKELRGELISLMSAAIEVSGSAANENSEAVVVAGERNLLQVNDLTENLLGLKKLFELFERKTKLLQLLELSRKAHGVKVFIGGESDVASLEEFSVIAAPYEIDGEIVGTVGVIGPRRMAYERVIPIVDITAKLLSSGLSQH